MNASRMVWNLLLAAAAATVLCGCDENRQTVEVSPDGPIRTAEAARDAVRAVRARLASEGKGPRAVEVVFADGTYRFTKPLELTAADGGTPDAPVVWRAKNRGRAIFSGATDVTWRKLTDESVLRLLPEAARGHVFVADVPGSGSLPSFQSGFERESENAIAVFRGDERLPCARWPNEGFALTGRAKSPDVPIGQRAKRDGRFAFDRAKLAEWAREPFPWVFGLWGVEWADKTDPLTGIDLETSSVVLPARVIPFGLKRGMPFYVFNALCELDRPGEWVVDRARRRVYLWGDAGDVVRDDGLVRAKGLADFAFDGFVFEKTRKSAVEIRDSARVTVRACAVRHTCSWAVEILGGRDCRVAGCDLYDLGEGGVLMTGGDPDTLARAGHVADNNHIHHYGRIVYNYRQGVSMRGVGMRAVHNLVHHSAHTGIYWSGTDNEIVSNVIHDTCSFNDDAGAIYVWHYSFAKRGGLIANNIVHHTGKKTYPRATEGIYLDDWASEVRVVSNLVNRATLGVLLAGGQANTASGNVLVNCERALALASRMGWPDPPKGKDSKILRGVTDHPERYDTPAWRAHFPGLGRLIDFAKTDPVNAHQAFWNTVTGNLGVGSGEFTHARWEAISNRTVWAENVSVTNDPGFADYANFDWTGAADSEFRALIDGCGFRQAGLYASPERLSPPVRFGSDVTPPAPIGTRTLKKPFVNLAVSLESPLPADVAAFAAETDECVVPGWSNGKWIFATFSCATGAAARWEEYGYSFVPTCDCTVRLVMMGAVGTPTLYDAVRVEGAQGTGPLFDCPYPIAADERDRARSCLLSCRKGVRVTVSFRAKVAAR